MRKGVVNHHPQHRNSTETINIRSVMKWNNQIDMNLTVSFLSSYCDQKLNRVSAPPVSRNEVPDWVLKKPVRNLRNQKSPDHDNAHVGEPLTEIRKRNPRVSGYKSNSISWLEFCGS